jgi:hypothetical protein
MKTITIPKWSASICIGMQKGYTDVMISRREVKSFLQEIQEIQIEREQLYLSANIFLSDIILSGQDESHINVNFINYPRFQSNEVQLKAGVLEIATYLMNKMNQNRIVITFDTEVVMLEDDPMIDENIITI